MANSGRKTIFRNIFFFLFFLSFTPCLFSQNPPLKVATTDFSPPFVMQGKNQLFGFDITLMEFICASLKRDCQYQILPFTEILSAVATQKVDVAIGAITITAGRAQIVNFSLPYMLSKSRFLGKKTLENKPINLQFISNSAIGLEQGTIFEKEIQRMGVANPTVILFEDESNIIEGLVGGSIDLALIDEPTAMYWQYHSGGILSALGRPYSYGFGYGIAVNHQNLNLLKAINQSILEYQNSEEFKINYNIYFSYF